MPENMTCAAGRVAQTDTRLAKASAAHCQFVYIFIFQWYIFHKEEQGGSGLYKRNCEMPLFYLLLIMCIESVSCLIMENI